ncbi:PREDICTED: uncharacterized protein LOC109357917 [Lupinus angustifolius]|uniref:uncharacterized protein LOC109357917 n=1 Tax=Lupinus angustifolius TaxID=3871 RepID=UPI00092E3D48|nr:PREDICTED: uncharacterized protein LOC109357917 [Lupinus angustifolius]
MESVGDCQRHQHKKVSNSLIKCITITCRRRCRRISQIMSFTKMSDCHQYQSKNRKSKKLHCLHFQTIFFFLWKKEGNKYGNKS